MDTVITSCRTCQPLRCGARCSGGFTLVELIIVLVLLGVLAVVAAPRIFNTGDFNARGFHDETLALLRYAQKAAIAQRRTVCVSFTANSASLQIASAATNTTCSANLTGPRGDTPGTVTAKSPITYSPPAPPPSEIRFDGLGQPLDNAGAALALVRTIQVMGASNTITIEPRTGYVHE